MCIIMQFRVFRDTAIYCKKNAIFTYKIWDKKVRLHIKYIYNVHIKVGVTQINFEFEIMNLIST